MSTKHFCHTCSSKNNLKICALCRQRVYCSRECQQEDWYDFHKYECAKIGGKIAKKIIYNEIEAKSILSRLVRQAVAKEKLIQNLELVEKKDYEGEKGEILLNVLKRETAVPEFKLAKEKLKNFFAIVDEEIKDSVLNDSYTHHTPLSKATFAEAPEVVEILLKNGADKSSGENPELLREHGGGSQFYRENSELIDLRLALVMSQNSIRMVEQRLKVLKSSANDYYPAACYAVELENLQVLRLLIKYGAELVKSNSKNVPDHYPLFRAVKLDNVEIVRLLLEKMTQKQLNTPGKILYSERERELFSTQGEHVLFFTAFHGSGDMLKMLLQEKKVNNSVSKRQEFPLESLQKLKNKPETIPDLVITVLNLYAENYYTWPDLKVYEILANDKKIDINAHGYDGDTALISVLKNMNWWNYYTNYGEEDGLSESIIGNDIAQLLISKKADVTIGNLLDNKPIIFAAAKANAKTVQMILKKGGTQHIDKKFVRVRRTKLLDEINAEVFPTERTPLSEAILKFQPKNALLLLEKGAKVSEEYPMVARIAWRALKQALGESVPPAGDDIDWEFEELEVNDRGFAQQVKKDYEKLIEKLSNI